MGNGGHLQIKQFKDKDKDDAICLRFSGKDGGRMCTVILNPEDQRFIYDAFTLDKKTAGQTYDVFCAYLKNQRRSPKGIHPETLNRVRSYISVQIKNRPDMETRELEHWDYVGNLEASRRLRNITHAGAVRAQAQHETHTSLPAHPVRQAESVPGYPAYAGVQHQATYQFDEPQSPFVHSEPSPSLRAFAEAQQLPWASTEHQYRDQPLYPLRNPDDNGYLAKLDSNIGDFLGNPARR